MLATSNTVASASQLAGLPFKASRLSAGRARPALLFFKLSNMTDLKNGGLGVKRRNVTKDEQTGRPPGRPPEG